MFRFSGQQAAPTQKPAATPKSHVPRPQTTNSPSSIDISKNNTALQPRDENVNPFDRADEDTVIPDSDEEVLLGSDEPTRLGNKPPKPPSNATTDERSSATVVSTDSAALSMQQKSTESLERELNTLKLTHGKVCSDLLALLDTSDATEQSFLEQTLLRNNKTYLDQRIKTVSAELERRAALDNSPVDAATSSSNVQIITARQSDASHSTTPQQSTSRFFRPACQSQEASPVRANPVQMQGSAARNIQPPPLINQNATHLETRINPVVPPANPNNGSGPIASTSRAAIQPTDTALHRSLPSLDGARTAAQQELEDLPMDAFADDFDLEEDDDDQAQNGLQRQASPFDSIAERSAPQWKGKQRDVDTSSRPWSRDVDKALRQRFGLQAFREHQKEAIDATLSGRDVFVLLPTGGGKSLCFQLPACITTGTTRGVTIVVSPLLSLIEDQCAALFSKDIPTVFLNSTMKESDRKFVMRLLSDDEPQCLLAYVTPEQINKSHAFKNIMSRLYRNERLARFVIDEAHCVSSWGHDFRPDYKELGCLKEQYPDVPIIALTATANNRVQEDIVATLRMRDPLKLQRSFNRPNLKYEVRSKTKNIIQDIATFIRAGHMQSCGIIYCSSKKQCEDTADKLRTDYRIAAKHYHAGMEKNERSRIQKGWQNGEFKVICATIAFGMGIDKPDVRFVIHYSLSQSLEAYYQETGRAGRDGKTSICVLFFSYADTKLIYRLIDEGDGTTEQKEANRSNVKRMVQYCLNTTDCRRKQVLSYFGENDFDPNECHKTCDNCLKGIAVETRDVSDLAKDAIRLVMSFGSDNVTMLHAVDVFRGSKTKKIVEAGHADLPQAGKGAGLDRGDCERLFQQLALDSAFGERFQRTGLGFTNAYITVGPRASIILSGKQRVVMAFSGKQAGGTGQAKKPRTSTSLTTSANQLTFGPEEIELSDDDDDAIVHEVLVDAWRPAARRLQTPGLRDVPDEVLLEDIHEKCFNELLAIRDRHALDEDVDPEEAISSTILQEIALKLPHNESEYMQIEGMTQDVYLFFTEARALRVVNQNRQILQQVAGNPNAAPVAGKKRTSDEAFRGIVSGFARPPAPAKTAAPPRAKTGFVPPPPSSKTTKPPAGNSRAAFAPKAKPAPARANAKLARSNSSFGAGSKKKGSTASSSATSGIRAMPIPGIK